MALRYWLSIVLEFLSLVSLPVQEKPQFQIKKRIYLLVISGLSWICLIYHCMHGFPRHHLGEFPDMGEFSNNFGSLVLAAENCCGLAVCHLG